jgi:hypothetical protein
MIPCLVRKSQQPRALHPKVYGHNNHPAFENEYQVPLIPWELAAYLGTAAELILPIFLVFIYICYR